MRWAGHKARIGDVRNALYIFFSENLKRKEHLGDLHVDGKLMLSFYLYLATPRCLFPSGFLAKILYAFSLPMRTTYPARPILLGASTLIYAVEFKL
jgi:hypothetical protein